MPSPWSSCQCQSELSAQVTLNPTPCHPHRKNTHLGKNSRDSERQLNAKSQTNTWCFIQAWFKVTQPHRLHEGNVGLFSFINGPAPSGVMVPSFTASGYLVSWKWRRAWLLPPEPSKYLRPHSTFPSVRFIQIFSWRSHTSHRQPLKCRKTKVSVNEYYINWSKTRGEKMGKLWLHILF